MMETGMNDNKHVFLALGEFLSFFLILFNTNYCFIGLNNNMHNEEGNHWHNKNRPKIEYKVSQLTPFQINPYEGMQDLR